MFPESCISFLMGILMRVEWRTIFSLSGFRTAGNAIYDKFVAFGYKKSLFTPTLTDVIS